jgi:hypothetical protein
MAQPRHQRVGARLQAHAIERRARKCAQLGVAPRISPEAERVPGMGLHRQRHIVERGEIRKQRCDLERARETERAAIMARQ